MKTSWYKNIKFRIALGFSLVFMVFVFTGNFFIYHQISDRLTQADNAYLLSRAQTLLDKTEAYPAVIPLPGRDENMLISLHEYGQVTPVFQSPTLQNLKQPDKDGIAEADTNRLASVSKNLDNGDSFIRLTLVKSSHPLQKDKQLLFIRLFFISLLAILISAITAYFIAVFLLKPIRSIIQSAQKITAQNEHVQIAVPDTQDEVNELAVTLNDMLGRIEEAARQQNAFFTSASHQLKTPLAIMKAELEVAGKHEADPKILQGLMLNQLDEVNDLQRIVQEFLWVGQIRARTLKLHLKSCYADELLLKTLQEMQRLIHAAELEIDLQYPDTPLEHVFADEEKLGMVFTNLLENAMKYVVKPGRLIIGIQTDDDHYTFRFENVYSAEENKTSAISSFNGHEHGLGLWLSREIMELHQGNLVVKTADKNFIAEIKLSRNKLQGE